MANQDFSTTGQHFPIDLSARDFPLLNAALRNYVETSLEEISHDVREAIAPSLPREFLRQPDREETALWVLHELIQMFVDYCNDPSVFNDVIDRLVHKVTRKVSQEGYDLEKAMETFGSGESAFWQGLVQTLAPMEFSTGSWFKLFSLRDGFKGKVFSSLYRAFVEEEYSAFERQAEGFGALTRLGEAAVSAKDMDRILKEILVSAMRLIKAEIGSVVLFQGENEDFEVVSAVGLAKGKKRAGLPYVPEAAFRTASEGALVVLKEAEFVAEVLPQPATGLKIRNLVSVPITVGEEVVGVFQLFETADRGLTEIERTTLLMFGVQMGIAVRNVRLFLEQKKRQRESRLLTEVATIMSESRDLNELLTMLAEKIAVSMNVSRCSIYFYEPETDSLMFIGGYGRSKLQAWLLSQFHLPMSEAGEATKRALATGTPALAEASSGEMNVESRVFRGPEVHSHLQIPLVFKKETIGLMSLEFGEGDPPFSEDDLALVGALAKQASVSMHNRRLQETLFEQQMAMRNAEVKERLYRARERSEAVIKASPNTVLLIDRNMKVVLSNPAAEYMTGWTPEEAEGRSCYEILYNCRPSDGLCENQDCPIYRVLQGEDVTHSEGEIVTRSGGRIPVAGTFSKIMGSDGTVESVVAVYIDISQQKELEKYAIFQREMEIASGIQDSLIPRGALSVQQFLIQAKLQQARMVGGDWYDFWHSGNRIYLVIGDASGIGVPAALFSTMAISAIRVEAREHEHILEVMEHVNRSLHSSNRTDSFVTVFFAVINLETMTMAYSNAGHEEPISVLPERRSVEELGSENRSLLGIFPEVELDVQVRKLAPGERLVFFTDGVIDAKNAIGKSYGLKRLYRFVTRNRDMTGEELIDALINDVLVFSGEEQRDDITVMVCDVPEAGPSPAG